MALEIERKYLGVDFDRLRQALVGADAKDRGAHFESNMVFDTPDRRLFATGRLLRVRRQEWREGTRCVLTLKLPAAPAVPGEFKTREERELHVENDMTMGRVLEGLGFAVVARYEKVRSVWEVASPAGSALVELDELPFARVVEVEGDPRALDAVAARLGLDKHEISTKSYHALHQEWRSAQGLPPQTSFVFGPEEWQRLRRHIGLPAQGRLCPKS